MKNKKVKSIFISDLHLFNKFCKADILSKFLKEYECENLFLIGDILDFYVKNITLDKDQINVIRKILTKAKRGTNVNYILGNHDETLEKIMDFNINIENIKFHKEFVYTSNNKNILLTHGHILDLPIIRNLYLIGDFCYNVLLHINHFYNVARKLLGFDYFSLSQKVKDSVKDAVKFIEDYENSIVKYTKQKKCEAVICGHIHKAEIKTLEGIPYLNCGDFLESCTAITEDYHGNFTLLQYKNNEFVEIKNIKL
jgi:UDP-2,3-diacylglucosamine pyrophosphatase LpxH